MGQQIEDTELLSLCGLPESVSAEALEAARLAAKRVAHSGDGPALAAVALAWAMVLADAARIEQSRFGHAGPTDTRTDTRKVWIERGGLERALAQLGGTIIGDGFGPNSVEIAINEGLRYFWLEEEPYDAWRPGMRSGSGWTSRLRLLPLGIAKVRTLGAAVAGPDASRLAHTGPNDQHRDTQAHPPAPWEKPKATERVETAVPPWWGRIPPEATPTPAPDNAPLVVKIDNADAIGKALADAMMAPKDSGNDSGKSRRPDRTRQQMAEDEGKIAGYIVKNPGAKRDEIAEATRIAAAHVSGSRAWKTHKAQLDEARKKNRATQQGAGGTGDPTADRSPSDEDA